MRRWFSTKPSVDALTQEDWEKAYQINAESGVGTFSLPYLGLESEEGKKTRLIIQFPNSRVIDKQDNQDV